MCSGWDTAEDFLAKRRQEKQRYGNEMMLGNLGE